jgi:cytochrome c oxidase subunit 2
MTRLPQVLAQSVAAAAGYMPDQASSVAPGVDRVFSLLFWISAFFFTVIAVVTVVFVIRYRQRPSRPAPEPSPSHSTRLEVFWSAVPLVLVFVIFGMSTTTWVEMTEARTGGPAPLKLQVTARRWSWWFDHPGGKGSAEMHLVAGRPAELVMASTDVLHSLYVPEFRLKQDVVPGRFTRMVFTPTAPGTFPVLCAEYCGTDHSSMSTKVVVHPDQASFDAWAREGMAPPATLVALGLHVMAAKGCAACHSADGTRRVGPTFKGLWGRKEALVGGATALVDEEYVRESVLKPSAKLVAGFPNVMPPVPLEERELQAVIAYLQSLKEEP